MVLLFGFCLMDIFILLFLVRGILGGLSFLIRGIFFWVVRFKCWFRFRILGGLMCLMILILIILVRVFILFGRGGGLLRLFRVYGDSSGCRRLLLMGLRM